MENIDQAVLDNLDSLDSLEVLEANDLDEDVAFHAFQFRSMA